MTVGCDAPVRNSGAQKLGSGPNEGTFGPVNFAKEFFETRAAFGLINVSGGTTTIQPLVRVSGSIDKMATYLHRCFTIEASTS